MFAVMGSRPAVGESYSTSGGAVTTARAMPTRRRMPPESSLGKLVERVLQFHEAQGFAHALVDLRFGEPRLTLLAQGALVDQRVRDVLGDGERIEQASLLEQDADLGCAYRTAALFHDG